MEWLCGPLGVANSKKGERLGRAAEADVLLPVQWGVSV